MRGIACSNQKRTGTCIYKVETYSQHTDPMDVPVSPISESEEDDHDIDLTPTTAKSPLPQSAVGAAAGAALGGIAAATFEDEIEECSTVIPLMIHQYKVLV